MANMDFNCGLCKEDGSEPPVQVRIIHGSMVCSECVRDHIVPLFRAALAHEHHYPPKWGTKKVLEFEDFRIFLTSAEQDEWEDKIEEYNTPVPNRIYCKHQLQASTADDGTVTSAGGCNTFMGSTTLQGGISSCSKCGGWSCRTCGGVYEVPEDTETDDDSMEIDHFCREKEPDVLEDPALEDHYQRCPNPACGFIVELESACNAMDCHRCDIVFCFLCGEVTTHDSGHWSRAQGSICPRYNRLGDAHAQYDDDPSPNHIADDPAAPDLLADNPAAPNPVVLNPFDIRNPIGPLQRNQGAQVWQDFRFARDNILEYDVVDRGQEYRAPANPDHALENDLGDVIADITRELEGAHGSVDNAPRPLRAILRLLGDLDTNIRYIRAVEGRHDIIFRARLPATTRFERADVISWHEEVHEELSADFLLTFDEAIEPAVVGSALVSFNPDTPGDHRVREIFDAYMDWDMTEYRAGALDVQLYHERREMFAGAQL
jgi:hypothetical protein